MAEIQVQKSDEKKYSKRKLYATVCFHYGYSLDYVSKLPARDLYLLSKTANEIQAINYMNLVNIVAAPHTKKGSGVKSLIKHYKGMVE